jgi:putative phosphoribosyl transferase
VGIERIGPEGGSGEFARVAHASGVVVLIPDGASPAQCELSRALCAALHAYGFSTVQLDVLGHRGAPDVQGRMLQLRAALDWLRETDGAHRVALLGCGLGASAALLAAAQRPACAAALASCNARLEAVVEQLPHIHAPTLLMVGGDDAALLRAHRQAMRLLNCAKRLEVVPGAGSHGQDSGALDAMANLAGDWFARHLRGPQRH